MTDEKTKATHTPGPWHQFGLSVLDSANAEKQAAGSAWGVDCIAYVRRQDEQAHNQWHDAVGLANARLIAAAPDLLAACESVVQATYAGRPTAADIRAVNKAQDDALMACRDAIAKARGEGAS